MLEALPIGDHTDPQCEGLTLRVRESGRSWSLRYRVRQGKESGPQRRLTLGAYGGHLVLDLGALNLSDFKAPSKLTLEGARVVGRVLVGLAELGVDPAEQLAAADRARQRAEQESARRVAEGTVTVGALVERMIQDRAEGRGREKPLRPNTVSNWRTLARTALAPLRDLDPATLTAREVRRWHERLGASGKRISANRALELLRITYSWAMKTEDERGEPLVAATPVVGIDPFKEKAREGVLTSDELAAVWSALDVEPFGDAIRALLWTGCPKTECTGAEWGEVDFRARLWTIPAERSKTGTARRVPLSSPCLAMLQARRDADQGGRFTT